MGGRHAMLQNRLHITQDFILTIVRLPVSWRPYALYDVPVSGEILSRTPVASYEEAHDDLLRCNRHALKTGSRVWAVIERAGSPLWQSVFAGYRKRKQHSKKKNQIQNQQDQIG